MATTRTLTVRITGNIHEGWFLDDPDTHPYFIPLVHRSHPKAKFGVRFTFRLITRTDDDGADNSSMNVLDYIRSNNGYAAENDDDEFGCTWWGCDAYFIIYDKDKCNEILCATPFAYNYPIMQCFFNSHDEMEAALYNRRLAIAYHPNAAIAIDHCHRVRAVHGGGDGGGREHIYFQPCDRCVEPYDLCIDAEVYAALNRIRYASYEQESGDGLTCAICLDSLRLNLRSTVQLDCRHAFHWQCIQGTGRTYTRDLFCVGNESSVVKLHRCALCRTPSFIAVDASEVERAE